MLAFHPKSKSLGHLVALIATLVVGTSPSGAQVFLLDFGAAANTTEHGPSPDDPAYFWNNVSESVGTSSTAQLPNLVTADNSPSTISLVMLSRFNGANTAGTTASTLFPAEATRDSLFGNTELFGSLSNVYPSFKLTGLDAATTYNFTFYASRTGVGDNRETGYTVQGGNTGLAALNAANNVTSVVTVDSITPDATGSITISLAPTANNNNANHFTYLGVMKLTAVPPQTPIIFTQEPSNQRVAEFQTATFTSAVQGSAPYYVQWLSNGVAIPGANQFTYTIPAVTIGMNGSQFSVNVSNLAFSATSSNAVLRVVTDTNPPVVLSATCPDGLSIILTFDELLDPETSSFEFSYAVNDGVTGVSAADLLADGKTVVLTLADRISGVFTVAITIVADLSLNEIAAGTVVSGTVPDFQTQSFLIDFGGTGVVNTTEHGPSPDDPVNYWNNVSDIGTQDNGLLPNLVTAQNRPTTVGLAMIRRFNGSNLNGTTTNAAPFPTDATRDSLFGNTEAFNGIENIFPSFKLTGLDQNFAYNFTMYASRTGVGDIRETGYTLVGANNGFAALNVANNVTNVAIVSDMIPDAAGEISISLAPTPNNNNGNHFTYLGVLKVDPIRPRPRFLAPVVSNGQITLTWTGNGQLEWAPAVSGPWTPYDPAPASGFSEALVAGVNRFFRLKASQ